MAAAVRAVLAAVVTTMMALLFAASVAVVTVLAVSGCASSQCSFRNICQITSEWSSWLLC
jgi:hypothetical protein